MTNTAAIILAAGKGTRMGPARINKVSFDCAGVPVIKRVVRNMREGGVERFVIVVGYRAESVMAALDGEKGIFFAYQSEQKGTGHAVGCGLRILEETGFSGRVIVSMGDKIVSAATVKDLVSVSSSSASPAVLGVLKRTEEKTSKGHVVMDGENVLGIVEAKDVAKALAEGAPITLCAKKFAPESVAATGFLNAALYSFDSAALAEALGACTADNAQGEIYLTDTIEYFAEKWNVPVCQMDPASMPTYSTRMELKEISHGFLRRASEFGTSVPRELIDAFIGRYGDRVCVVASSPGRVNIMGRHIEHRGGSVNMMAIEKRFTIIASPRNDDLVRLANLDPAFPPGEFRISDYLDVSGCGACGSASAASAAWLEMLETQRFRSDLDAHRGDWINYVKSAVLRFQFDSTMPLCGMDIMAVGEIPVAAGLSSSSAIVVAVAEALVALNELNLPDDRFVDLCGEGEWFVGSRGGAGDHAAMKCSSSGRITHLKFKPFSIGESVPFPPDLAIVVVESGEQAKKAEGAREIFNSRIRDYETAFIEIKRRYPDLPVVYFRDIAFLADGEREAVLSCLPDGVKGVARFGIDECRRAEECVELLKSGDFEALGEMMKASHDGDRVGAGGYECSTVRIDALCDSLNAMPGVLGSQLVGAGLGGCVIALVRKDASSEILSGLRSRGYAAIVAEPSRGSSVEF